MFNKVKSIEREAKNFKPKLRRELIDNHKLTVVNNLNGIQELKSKISSGNGYITLSYVLSYFNQYTAQVLIPSYSYIIKHFELAINQGCVLAYHYYINFLINGETNFHYQTKKPAQIEELLLTASKYDFYSVYKHLLSMYSSNDEKSRFYKEKLASLGSSFAAYDLFKYFVEENNWNLAVYWSFITEKLVIYEITDLKNKGLLWDSLSKSFSEIVKEVKEYRRNL